MNKRKVNFLLILVSLFWGASYVLTKICLNYTTTYNLIFYRFFVSFIITFLFFRKKILPIKRLEVMYSILLSFILLLVFITMTEALSYTTASNVGFIISLSVVFVPIFSYFISNEKVTKKNFFLVMTSVLGIYFISVQDKITVQFGDLLSLICSLLFALHVSLTGKFVKKCNSITLGVLQFGFTSLYSIFLLDLKFTELTSINFTFFISFLLLAIFSTTLGYIFQLIAQKYASSTSTAIILSLEPVFSAIFAYYILYEVLSLKQIFGAGLLLTSVLAMEINYKKVREEKL